MDTVLLRGVGAGCGSKSPAQQEARWPELVSESRYARSHAQVRSLPDVAGTRARGNYRP